MPADQSRTQAQETIELTVPFRSELLILVRLTASTLASQAGFSVEEIDDLRLAADELCLSVTSGELKGPMRLRFVVGEDSIELTCAVEADSLPQPADADEAAWSLRILDALVDEHDLEMIGGQRRAWLRKRRASASN